MILYKYINISKPEHSFFFIESYKELWQWSVDNTANFWEEFWYFSDLKYSRKFESVSLFDDIFIV